jgi:hypothetical protein
MRSVARSIGILTKEKVTTVTSTVVGTCATLTLVAPGVSTTTDPSDSKTAVAPSATRQIGK